MSSFEEQMKSALSAANSDSEDEDEDDFNPHFNKPRTKRKSAFRAPRITYHKGVSWETGRCLTYLYFVFS